jgi:hypothetical protein
VTKPELPGARLAGDVSDGSAPPFWGRWGRIYLLVAGLLAVETVVFWWLTRWAS